MEALKIDKQEAKRLYPAASPAWKATFESTFGKDCFSQKITDRVKTYEDACAELGIAPINESELLKLGFERDEITYRKIKTITRVLNEGWKADWGDDEQRKWYPWFDTSSGFVFDDASYGYSSASAGGAARLCFKNEELAKYAGKQFLDLYKDFII